MWLSLSLSVSVSVSFSLSVSLIALSIYCLLCRLNVFQDAVAAIIGFWGGIAGQITGVLLSISSDFLGGRKRAMLIGLSGISVALIGVVDST